MDSPFLASVLLPLAIAAIMCSLGLALTPADFRRVLSAPRGVAIGMVNLALISPLLAFAMAELFDLPPDLAVGLLAGRLARRHDGRHADAPVARRHGAVGDHDGDQQRRGGGDGPAVPQLVDRALRAGDLGMCRCRPS